MLWFALSGQVSYAIAIVSDTYILEAYDAVSYTPVISLLPGIILLVLNPGVIKKFKKYTKISYLKNLSFFGFFYSIQAICYYVALNKGADLSQIAPIFRAEIIFTVILATMFLKERDNLFIKFLAAFIAILGVFMIK